MKVVKLGTNQDPSFNAEVDAKLKEIEQVLQQAPGVMKKIQEELNAEIPRRKLSDGAAKGFMEYIPLAHAVSRLEDAAKKAVRLRTSKTVKELDGLIADYKIAVKDSYTLLRKFLSGGRLVGVMDLFRGTTVNAADGCPYWPLMEEARAMVPRVPQFFESTVDKIDHPLYRRVQEADRAIEYLTANLEEISAIHSRTRSKTERKKLEDESKDYVDLIKQLNKLKVDLRSVIDGKLQSSALKVYTGLFEVIDALVAELKDHGVTEYGQTTTFSKEEIEKATKRFKVDTRNAVSAILGLKVPNVYISRDAILIESRADAYAIDEILNKAYANVLNMDGAETEIAKYYSEAAGPSDAKGYMRVQDPINFVKTVLLKLGSRNYILEIKRRWDELNESLEQKGIDCAFGPLTAFSRRVWDTVARDAESGNVLATDVIRGQIANMSVDVLDAAICTFGRQDCVAMRDGTNLSGDAFVCLSDIGPDGEPGYLGRSVSNSWGAYKVLPAAMRNVASTPLFTAMVAAAIKWVKQKLQGHMERVGSRVVYDFAGQNSIFNPCLMMILSPAFYDEAKELHNDAASGAMTLLRSWLDPVVAVDFRRNADHTLMYVRPIPSWSDIQSAVDYENHTHEDAQRYFLNLARLAANG